MLCTAGRFSRVRLFVTASTVPHQAPLSMGFLRQEYWSGLPFPSPGNFPDPGIELTSLVSPVLRASSLPFEPQGEALGSSDNHSFEPLISLRILPTVSAFLK